MISTPEVRPECSTCQVCSCNSSHVVDKDFCQKWKHKETAPKPTKCEFFDSVDTWIYRLTGDGEPYSCGFCLTHDRVDRSMGTITRCHSGSCMVSSLCENEYNVWSIHPLNRAKLQANLRILEGLYIIGLDLGYFKKLEADKSD